MEWLTIISMICSDKTGAAKKDCQDSVKNCVEWIIEQPEIKSKNLSNSEIALWVSDKKIMAKICK